MSGNLNLPGSRRGSGIGGFPSRRESGLLSIDPSTRRGSGLGSIAPSRRGSTTASISPSRRGSFSTSRRGSIEKSISGSIMFNRRLSGRGSLMGTQRRSSIISNTMQRAGGEGMLGAEELMTLTMFASRKVDINRLAGLVKALEIAERAVVLNTFHDKLLFYRDFKPREQKRIMPRKYSSSSSPVSQTKSASSSPSSNGTSGDVLSAEQVHKLWDFQCDLTEGRNVSCMVWNKTSRDLLSVGYGEFEFGTQKGGLIAFWSLKNPRYPHATIPTHSDVTALDFSTNSPNLLAVGFYDGNVAVYDAKNYKEREPLMQTGASTGKHNDPVWKLQWIDATSDHGETLISISTDGRVSQWSLKKDLEFVNLMRLKKIMAHSKGAQPQPFISRHAAGLCFDFSPRDPSLYLVGTEEGLIHKCSRSYNEQYLQSYVGHTGPVFQVRWSTVLPYIFLSCSSDWSVRLWREEQESALLVFQTANESVGDIRWSCKHSCVFGTVSDDGRLEIWDMAVTAMKPVIVYPFANTKLSCLLFSEDAPVVLAGGSTGAISVFRLVGFDVVQSDIDELLKLKRAITSNVNTILD
ncbi:WD repeat-containing protein 78 isoform X1 [Selaginella moellendorffii]|uniref:WD repeat-containing protein 78 isoform X1 n=1 Tax=Selaginella moellendorffii TaxID=88036 RepID=UPI000D1CB45D|nr:WD repeat-containing protein 78 isoform X1 [Selaginella moellendorffii]XP_024536382.1 WD repeat-containing protein 78 isoform X1 [Selaginella moellendorffii]XP_024536383.1 WD repeat-containing protein 78 isoform X1 [Selaginella moellendorffii]XP_024536384.1 WD repeat-containing protein 78 isoform X1 [Selaginella moellendorffii]XP_024536385.1 WD repeat-containing protein 78 isoform X1 [Selaginella moellendorffii]|eukprot:XP_024536381.1 WD repeat-containing protein 78 isoform X1 [Selaginella moellendorffii]